MPALYYSISILSFIPIGQIKVNDSQFDKARSNQAKGTWFNIGVANETYITETIARNKTDTRNGGRIGWRLITQTVLSSSGCTSDVIACREPTTALSSFEASLASM